MRKILGIFVLLFALFCFNSSVLACDNTDNINIKTNCKCEKNCDCGCLNGKDCNCVNCKCNENKCNCKDCDCVDCKCGEDCSCKKKINIFKKLFSKKIKCNCEE